MRGLDYREVLMQSLFWGGVACAGRSPSPPLSAAAPQVVVTDGSLRSRLSSADEAELVIYYAGENAGKIGTCGCVSRARGSLGRLQSFVQASRAIRGAAPSLVVNTGGWLEPELPSESSDWAAFHPAEEGTRGRNAEMLHALSLGDWDVLNIAPMDWLFLSDVGRPVAAGSAHRETEAPRVHSFVFDGMTVAVIGVSGGFDEPPEVALREALTSLKERPDWLIVLAHDVGDSVDALSAFSEVDVFIESGGFRYGDPPWFSGSTLWVRSRADAVRVGELRLKRDGTGVTLALDRQIDLDASIPTAPAYLRYEGPNL